MTQLTRLAAQAGYAVYDGTAYGRTNGIYFNVATDPGHGVSVRAYIRPIETLTFRDTGRGRGIDLVRINDYLKVRRRDYGSSTAQADERSLWLTLEGEPKAESVSAFLYEFSRYLSDSGYVSSCAICPKTRSLGHRLQNGQVLEVCPACAEKHSSQLHSLAPQHGIKSSYMRGAAGAALGGITGMILWILVNFAGSFSFICGVPMAYFVYKGYHMLHGKHSRNMFAILFAALIVFTYIAVMTCEGIIVYRARMDAGFTTGLFSEIGGMMTGLLYPGVYDTPYLMMRLGIGLLFSGLGGFALVLRFRRENGAGIKPVPKRSERTLRH